MLGNEPSHQAYVSNIVRIFSEVKRVLRKDGSCWLNLGDKYVNKNLMGIPWRVAIAMQDDGWILRNDIIWDQMKGTQSAKDRLRDIYEHVFHFVKNKKYYYEADQIRIQPRAKPRVRGNRVISATGCKRKEVPRANRSVRRAFTVGKARRYDRARRDDSADAAGRNRRFSHDDTRTTKTLPQRQRQSQRQGERVGAKGLLHAENGRERASAFRYMAHRPGGQVAKGRPLRRLPPKNSCSVPSRLPAPRTG